MIKLSQTAKAFFLLLALFPFIKTVDAQAKANWVIENEIAGTGILYRPNDYIDEELNSSNLIITGSPGDQVVSPVDGIVTNVTYGYMTNLKRTQSFKSENNSQTNDMQLRQRMAVAYNKSHSEVIDANYIHCRVAIHSKDHGDIHLQGIINPSSLITGQKIEKGQILGEIGYCYGKIDRLNLMISRTVYGKVADPMGIFGLQTTFKKPVSTTEKTVFQPSELQEDFKILKDALFEGYPGLDDYVSTDSLIQLYRDLQTALKAPATKKEFTAVVQRLINPLRDNHFNIINGDESCHAEPNTEFYFGVQSDSLVVIRCLTDFKNFLGKKIRSIDGLAADELIETIKTTIPVLADGYNESMLNYEMQTVFWSYFKRHFNKQEGDSLVFSFSDGTVFRTTYRMNSINDYTRYARPRKSKQLFTTAMLNDSVAYLDINTFSLFEETENQIGRFIDSLSVASVNNLIIDLRANPGGHEKSMAKIFSYLANSPFKTTIAQKVTSVEPYKFSKNTVNLVQDESVFPEFSVQKEGGYYLPDSLIDEYRPDSKVNYNGRVFVLTDSFTFSAAALFAGLTKKYERGIIVGRETGGAYCQMNALKFATIHLPNTKTDILMPLVQLRFDEKYNDTNAWGRGVLPDREIPLTMDEFVRNSDVFLIEAMQVIATGK